MGLGFSPASGGRDDRLSRFAGRPRAGPAGRVPAGLAVGAGPVRRPVDRAVSPHRLAGRGLGAGPDQRHRPDAGRLSVDLGLGRPGAVRRRDLRHLLAGQRRSHGLLWRRPAAGDPGGRALGRPLPGRGRVELPGRPLRLDRHARSLAPDHRTAAGPGRRHLGGQCEGDELAVALRRRALGDAGAGLGRARRLDHVDGGRARRGAVGGHAGQAVLPAAGGRAGSRRRTPRSPWGRAWPRTAPVISGSPTRRARAGCPTTPRARPARGACRTIRRRGDACAQRSSSRPTAACGARPARRGCFASPIPTGRA